jgi:hypothetical protein
MSNLFSFFRLNQLKPAWEFDASAFIWRIFFTSANRVVGESRNESAKSTSFFCVDAHSGQPLWKDVKLDEPWWIGIETVYDNWVILHGFVRPDMPEHRGISVMKIESGKVIWKNDELAFWFIEHEKLYAQKYLFEKRIGYELDINTGEVLGEYIDNLEVLEDKRKNVLQDKINERRDLLFTEIYNSNRTDPLINDVIRRITDERALSEWIEYFVNKDILLLSYYQVEQKDGPRLLDNILTVYDLKSEKTLFNEIIGKELQVPSHDTFIIKDDFVYFIKNQSILTAIQPWKS